MKGKLEHSSSPNHRISLRPHNRLQTPYVRTFRPRVTDPPLPPLRPIRFSLQVGNCGPGGGAGPGPAGVPRALLPTRPALRRGRPTQVASPAQGRPTQVCRRRCQHPTCHWAPEPRVPRPCGSRCPTPSHPHLIPGGLRPPGRYSRPSSPVSSRVPALYPKGLPRRCRLRGCWRRRQLEVPATGPGPAGRTARTRRRGRWARRVWR